MAEISSKPDIVDIRIQSKPALDSEHDLRRQITKGLLQPSGHKSLPTLLLYDEVGLRLYDDITTEAPEYYLFAAEEEILQKYADDIAQAMHWRDNGQVNTGEIVLELGAG
jgi:L-histidine Nalpha-methyltransferase / hercynylcysteine S-oxide synthase